MSPTALAAQRHMDAHQGVKAFRCTICRYKGNTLRGMRTHIRMHFEKRGTDLQVIFHFLELKSFFVLYIDNDNMYNNNAHSKVFCEKGAYFAQLGIELRSPDCRSIA